MDLSEFDIESGGQQMGNKVSEINQAIRATVTAAGELTTRERDNLSYLDSVAGDVMQGLGQSLNELSVTSLQLQQETRVTQATIEEIVVSLQFQDRTDQMLDHLQHDMQRLDQAVRVGDGSVSDPQQSSRNRSRSPRPRRARLTTIVPTVSVPLKMVNASANVSRTNERLSSTPRQEPTAPRAMAMSEERRRPVRSSRTRAAAARPSRLPMSAPLRR